MNPPHWYSRSHAETGDGSWPGAHKGACVFISAGGYIVTNNHVVAEATEITVTLKDHFDGVRGARRLG